MVAAMLFPVISTAQELPYNNSVIYDLDLSRYLGKWYEIARFDHRFERGMDNVTAEYILRDDGALDVINTGWKNGKVKVAKGKAIQPSPKDESAHLKVSFFGPFYSDYNVMMIGDDYEIALVGSKSPKYLWILARNPYISDEVVGQVLEEAEGRGYNTGNLIWVDHSSFYRQ